MTHKTHTTKYDSLVADPAAPPVGSQWYRDDLGVMRKRLTIGGVPTTRDFACVQPVVVVNNTDTTTNINDTTVVTTPFPELFGAVSVNTQPAAYAVNLAAGTITITDTGLYEITAAVAMVEAAGATARTNIAMVFAVGGVEVSPRYQNNYMRDASGHNEVSQTVTLLRQFTAGDVIEMRRFRVAGSTGTVVLEGTNNFVAVKRIL